MECSCHSGYQLASDEKTCTGNKKNEQSNLWFCLQFLCVLQRNKMSTNVSLAPTTVTCCSRFVLISQVVSLALTAKIVPTQDRDQVAHHLLLFFFLFIYYQFTVLMGQIFCRCSGATAWCWQRRTGLPKRFQIQRRIESLWRLVENNIYDYRNSHIYRFEYHKDVNECDSQPPVCPAQTLCQNTIGSYTCARKPQLEECPLGFRFNSQIQTCIGILIKN